MEAFSTHPWLIWQPLSMYGIYGRIARMCCNLLEGNQQKLTVYAYSQRECERILRCIVSEVGEQRIMYWNVVQLRMRVRYDEKDLDVSLASTSAIKNRGKAAGGTVVVVALSHFAEMAEWMYRYPQVPSTYRLICMDPDYIIIGMTWKPKGVVPRYTDGMEEWKEGKKEWIKRLAGGREDLTRFIEENTDNLDRFIDEMADETPPPLDISDT